ncbi:ABC transporter permease [Streptomyces rapamycinicus]|uniref:Peptide ABC transporter permease n=2 Tax=Streptomyces rapamycinicus TaxID=1226757 RepID=A0A0A0NFG2_STRRN|nr:ABC transporter permease [Streptomyces rapamycinicus]AGP54813.1 peptide ABC transporter permease [Streptomyces rapamycinicus NRRL 5491]MBB4782335.1 peptide/nickel transport system permease protein [Streptomyces rapamycinicus]RLV82181.1 peptide ABC transporter permease [Streptomyces rapamycinicus NRRL 5491]UTO62857.1 ABC transporter permease [Streptomyces rapamycinicus]UTP30815.1 ABC transporter permease [Streptomyces rapamycinicus NRRL 5491]
MTATAAGTAPAVDETAVPTPSLARRTLAVFTRNKLALAGAVVLVALSAFCFLGPLFHSTDQVHTDLGQANLAPGSPGHPLGTTDLGYDMLGRLMTGGRTSLEVGLAAGLLATFIGTVYGSVAGYFGGWLDAAMMRITDAALAIPALFLLVVVAAIVTPSKLVLILIIASVAWLSPARLIRGEALALRSRDYIHAMRLMGGGGTRAVFRHIVPNAIGTVVVNATFQIADAILYVAYLSFLGLSIPPPAADWGSMLSAGITYTQVGYWWLIFPPGIAIVLVVAAFNFIGDGLRDAFDVRLQKRGGNR